MLHATYYILRTTAEYKEKMNNIKHLNVLKIRPRSPQSSHCEVPVHRTTQKRGWKRPAERKAC